MTDQVDQSRRKLLAKLGIAASGAYIAPAIIGLDAARASGGSSARRSARSRSSRGSGVGTRQPARQPAARQPAPRQPVYRAPPPPPEIVMLLPAAPGIDPGADPVLEAAGYRIIAGEDLALGRLYRLALPEGRSPEAALTELAQLFPQAIPDSNALYTTDDFLCTDGTCGAHEMIGWSGWPSAMGPKIGMIDTGVNPDHDAFTGQKLILRQQPSAESEQAGRQHGTAIAALLIGRMGSRTPGLLPHAELHAVEAFHRRAGHEAADAYSIAAALDHLIREGVSVINMSFSGPENQVVHAMILRAFNAGIGLVAAAGNGGPGAPPAWPAAWPEVVAVTAVDAGGEAWRQANRGAYVTLAAPGVNLWTAASVSGGRLRSGTSYAAPFVTAVLAVERQRAPLLSLDLHLQRLIGCAKDLGDSGFDETFGHGIISSPDQCVIPETAGDDPFFTISGE